MWTTTPECFDAELEARVKRALDKALAEAAEHLKLDYQYYPPSMFSGENYYFDGSIPTWLNEVRDSIHVDRTGEGEFEITFGSAHARFIEEGTRPHRPPIAKIKEWAMAHGWDPYALASNMEKYGTRAHPFVHEGIDRNLEAIKNIFVAALVEELSA